jgi:hypothetical protein
MSGERVIAGSLTLTGCTKQAPLWRL